ncbi:3-hydroxyisobutyrate dehydrogenase-like beta-hydroxyacid dehydrogenase [Evansella vedderi]|uniref:3-hydroxyisobutyrate dehydrogenase-like beta-hydroxyacid dehydrogenase n=1 Tax=Evansella vedderi TaxID=38282 RepID=A0ABT9ZP28_9BACI|nr:NAD(P)-dependent oxidoreductase [Evansella vedderi]MDQ0252988.1 3-hydroxyisobutyrate dehydrogenase-like beta-hydroxyacid dehydrogenase [Evansella vedderi]
MDERRKVGVVGCGAMGRGIIKNLVLGGYEVYAFDVNEAAMNSVKELGAHPIQEKEQMYSLVHYLITSLPTPQLVEETITGKNGAIHFMENGSYILDVSTTDVETTRRIYQEAKGKGISFFDCPLSGGPEGADKGELTIIVGGDEATYATIYPLLSAIGKEIEYIGDSGTGQVIKLCNNMVVAGIVTLLSEALLTGVKSGVPAEKIASMFQKGSAHTKVMSVFGPNLISGDHENVKFMLQHMSKDIQLYMDLAKKEKIPTFFSATVDQFFTIAKNNGKGALDTTAVSQVLEDLAESTIVPK